MSTPPAAPRAIAFFDAQNLFKAAREAFGYRFPNFDPRLLAERLCQAQQWHLSGVRLYTGIPSMNANPVWHKFWSAKLLALSRAGAFTYSRPLRYRTKSVTLPDLGTHTFTVAEEKGIDVRIAIDIVRLAHKKEYDVAIVYSQDQDLSEVAKEIRTIAREQGRWIKVASAFPVGPSTLNRRGIDATDWIPIDKASYDLCIDTTDYRPREFRDPS